MARTHQFVAIAKGAPREMVRAFHGFRRFRYGYDVVRTAVALLLLVAAGLKAYQLSTAPILRTGLLASRWFLIGVVEFELFFGLWLASGLAYVRHLRGTSRDGLTWLAAVVCFSLFAGVSFYEALCGYATCGCFGKVTINPWHTTALDVLVVLCLFYWRPNAEIDCLGVDRRRLSIRLFCVLGLSLVLGGPAAYAMGSNTRTTLSDAGSVFGDGRTVVLEPEKWVGKRFPLLAYIDIGERLKKGSWLIVLYHSDCPVCAQLIENLPREVARKNDDRRVALIELPPYGQTADEGALSEAGVVVGRLTNALDWFVTTPAQAHLENGRVIKATVGMNIIDHAFSSTPVVLSLKDEWVLRQIE